MNSVTVEAYVRFFESLTPDRLAGLKDLCTPDVRFRDPFNDNHGIDHMRGVFERMYANTNNPRFDVFDYASSLKSDVWYIRWRFTAQIKDRPITIDGMSEVRLADDGKVAEHIDHWDAASQLYERIPVLGFLLRRLRHKLAA